MFDLWNDPDKCDKHLLQNTQRYERQTLGPDDRHTSSFALYQLSTLLGSEPSLASTFKSDEFVFETVLWCLERWCNDAASL